MRRLLQRLRWRLRPAHRYELRLPDGSMTYTLRPDDSITIRNSDGDPVFIVFYASRSETWLTVKGDS